VYVSWDVQTAEYLSGMSALEDFSHQYLINTLDKSSCSNYIKTLLVNHLSAMILNRKYSTLWIYFEKIPYDNHQEYLTIKYGNPFDLELINKHLSPIKSLLYSFFVYKRIEYIHSKYGNNRYLLDGDGTYEWKKDYYILGAESIKNLEIDSELIEYLFARHIRTNTIKYEVTLKYFDEFKALYPNSKYLSFLEEKLSKVKNFN
jgi:hypothetical protein